MSEHLTILTEHIQKRYPEGQFLYKSCSTADESWIVVLELTKYARTNQTRLLASDPNRKYAKFRSSLLKVIDIINKFDQTKTIDSIESSVYTESKVKYVKKKIVKSNLFDCDLSEVCSNGIHFFESIEAAFYYELRGLHNYTGHWTAWDDDGQKYSEGDFLNGEKTGHWIEWDENGRKIYEVIFSNYGRTCHLTV